MVKNILVALLLVLAAGAVYSASTQVQYWSWDATKNAFVATLNGGDKTHSVMAREGATDGSSASAGTVGEFLSATSSLATPNCLTASPTITVSKTLTPGTWLYGGSGWVDNRSGVTGGYAALFAKGAAVGGSTYSDDVMLTVGPTAIASTAMTLSPHAVNIVAADADKTVAIKMQSIGANTACYAYIWALRIH